MIQNIANITTILDFILGLLGNVGSSPAIHFVNIGKLVKPRSRTTTFQNYIKL